MSREVADELAARAADLLIDGEWHDWEWLVRELMKLVPPGVALRHHAESVLAAREQRRRQGIAPGPGRPEAAVEERIRTGKRAIVREHLKNPRVYEVEHAPPAGRRVRMVGRPRVIAETQWHQLRYKSLERELEQVRAQVTELRKYLVEHGHGDAAELLAPE